MVSGVLPIAIWEDGLLHRKPTIAQLHRFPAPNQRNIDVSQLQVAWLDTTYSSHGNVLAIRFTTFTTSWLYIQWANGNFRTLK